MGGMERAGVMAWVAAYEQVWREGDLDGVASLFSEDVRYLTSPYAEPLVGLDAVRASWLDDEGQTFTAAAEPVAVEGNWAVVRVLVRYGDPVRQEYTDLWVLEFADDGRVSLFEEWPYWPDKPSVADGDAS